MGRPPKTPGIELLAFVRTAVESGNYRVLPHARIRCSERDVGAPDIENALLHGRPVPRRDRYDDRFESWSYCFEGPTIDDEQLRVVVAVEHRLLIVTVIRLTDGEE